MTKAEHRGSAWGKLILFGEHAVVYGHPAMAAAVDLRTVVCLRSRPGPVSLAGGGEPDSALSEVLHRILPRGGATVEIRSQLPVGRGMGSSAALSVALVRAAAAREGEALDAHEVYARSLALEAVFHGNPSGVDNTVAAGGGAVLFSRSRSVEPQRVALTPLPLVILDSGSSGNTRALVEGVRARRPAIDPLLARMGTLAEQAAKRADRPSDWGPLLDENHRLLIQIGVSTERLDALVAFARRHGSPGAKLSGAGGGGVVMALAPPEGTGPLVQRARREGILASSVRVPAHGIPSHALPRGASGTGAPSG